MASDPGTTQSAGARSADRTHSTAVRRSTETKHSSKTSELYVWAAVTVAILLAAALIKGGDTEGTDEFIARQAWLYIAIISAAYMVSRGLAKAGSRDPYTDDDRH